MATVACSCIGFPHDLTKLGVNGRTNEKLYAPKGCAATMRNLRRYGHVTEGSIPITIIGRH